MGWLRSGALTPNERKAMRARLAECGGLSRWRELMLEVERSNYLKRTKPDLRFLLDADNFAQLRRGRYAPEADHKKKLSQADIWAAFAKAGSSR